VLIEQANDVDIEAVEAADPVDRFLCLSHEYMIHKILDFVKYL
jgi:hypothetical protein